MYEKNIEFCLKMVKNGPKNDAFSLKSRENGWEPTQMWYDMIDNINTFTMIQNSIYLIVIKLHFGSN